MPATKFSAISRFPPAQWVLLDALGNRLQVEYSAGPLTWQTHAKSCRRLMRKYEKAKYVYGHVDLETYCTCPRKQLIVEDTARNNITTEINDTWRTQWRRPVFFTCDWQKCLFDRRLRRTTRQTAVRFYREKFRTLIFELTCNFTHGWRAKWATFCSNNLRYKPGRRGRETKKQLGRSRL